MIQSLQKTKKSKLKTNVKTPMKKAVSEVKKSYKEYPRSYRLDVEMMDILKTTLHRLNQVSPKKVSEARLIKALIILSQEMDEKSLIRGIKQVW